MPQHRCRLCGYVYDPTLGDIGPGPGHDIAPGTAFQSLPDDWRCPDCRAPKSEFVPVEAGNAGAGTGA